MRPTPSRTQKPKRPPVPPTLALEMSHAWTERALFQGRRLRALLERQLTYDDERATPQQRNAYRSEVFLPLADGPQFVDVMESHFLLVAIRHVLLWLGRFRTDGGDDKTVLSAARDFEASLRPVKDLRDMLEHEDEYLVGAGNKRDEYEIERSDMTLSAHSVIAEGTGYLIGGRVHSEVAVPALEKLSPVLWKALEAHIAEQRRRWNAQGDLP